MKTATYLHLPAGQLPPSLDGFRPFKAVLVIEQPATAEWQSLVSEWPVRSGCLCLMAWGRDCGRWDDSVDHANLSAFDFRTIPDHAFVTTSWHARELLREPLWFAVHCAIHRMIPLNHMIVVHISAEERRAELLKAIEMAS